VVVSLEVYHRKRKFDLTPEPRGRLGRRKGNQHVIQKHAARQLHYDLRLELGGVMKSWAVAKGPSLVPGAGRLGVQVEDHYVIFDALFVEAKTSAKNRCLSARRS
jgi:bifunctional non-homologous end joining protein LigD